MVTHLPNWPDPPHLCLVSSPVPPPLPPVSPPLSPVSSLSLVRLHCVPLQLHSAEYLQMTLNCFVLIIFWHLLSENPNSELFKCLSESDSETHYPLWEMFLFQCSKRSYDNRITKKNKPQTKEQTHKEFGLVLNPPPPPTPLKGFTLKSWHTFFQPHN